MRSNLQKAILEKVRKDSTVMKHELEADSNAVFERLAKISNALIIAVESSDDYVGLLIEIANELGVEL